MEMQGELARAVRCSVISDDAVVVFYQSLLFNSRLPWTEGKGVGLADIHWWPPLPDGLAHIVHPRTLIAFTTLLVSLDTPKGSIEKNL